MGRPTTLRSLEEADMGRLKSPSLSESMMGLRELQ